MFSGPISTTKNGEPRVYTHLLYESLIEDTFGKPGVFGLGKRDGMEYFHTLSWRNASSFLENARRNRAEAVRTLRVSNHTFDRFISYIEQGVATYTISLEGKNLDEVLLEITNHGVSRSLS